MNCFQKKSKLPKKAGKKVGHNTSKVKKDMISKGSTDCPVDKAKEDLADTPPKFKPMSLKVSHTSPSRKANDAPTPKATSKPKQNPKTLPVSSPKTPNSPSKKKKVNLSGESVSSPSKQSPKTVKNPGQLSKKSQKELKKSPSSKKSISATIDSLKKKKPETPTPPSDVISKSIKQDGDAECKKQTLTKSPTKASSRDNSPKKNEKSASITTSDASIGKKRGRPKGSKNKVKDPNDKESNTPKSKLLSSEKQINKSSTPKNKDVKVHTSEHSNDPVKTEKDVTLDSLSSSLGADVDHYIFHTDDASSECEDLLARRNANKAKRLKTEKKGSKDSPKLNTSSKSDLCSGWETMSDLDISLIKNSAKKNKDEEPNPNVKSAIDSVLKKVKNDSLVSDAPSSPVPSINAASSPKVAHSSSVSKKSPLTVKNLAASETLKEDSSADDEESDDDLPSSIKKPRFQKMTKDSSNKKVTKRKVPLKSTKLSRDSKKKKAENNSSDKSVTFASEDEESHKDSDSEEESKAEKKKRVRPPSKTKPRKKVVDSRPPSPPRRQARMASLNARAVMVCMNEDARIPFHVTPRSEPKNPVSPRLGPKKTVLNDQVQKEESTIAQRHTDDDSDEDSEDNAVQIRLSGKRKKEEQASKTKKVRKKRRGELDVQMDIRDMVVTKRMASLNASAIMAASYCVESRKRTPISTASSSAESEVNLNFKRKISYKSTRSKGTKSRSVITVQETTKKLKKAEGTRETEVEERIIFKKKVKSHSGKNNGEYTDREEEDDNATDASEINQDEIIPKSPDDNGMIVESTITYISTQTDTLPQTVSVSGVSSYCISSGEGKTTTFVQQVERKSKTTTTKCTAYSTGAPPTAFIPPTHIQVRNIDNNINSYFALMKSYIKFMLNFTKNDVKS